MDLYFFRLFFAVFHSTFGSNGTNEPLVVCYVAFNETEEEKILVNDEKSAKKLRTQEY